MKQIRGCGFDTKLTFVIEMALLKILLQIFKNVAKKIKVCAVYGWFLKEYSSKIQGCSKDQDSKKIHICGTDGTGIIFL